MRRSLLLSLVVTLAQLAASSPAAAARPPLSSSGPRLHRFAADEPAAAGAPADVARAALRRHAAALHLDEKAIDNLVVDHVLDTGRGGVVVRFRHVEQGLPVWHDALNVLLRRDGGVVSVGGQFHDVPDDAIDFDVDAATAVTAALASVFGGKYSADSVTLGDVDGAGYQRATLADARLRLRTLRVKPVLAPAGSFVVGAFVVEVAGSKNGARPQAFSIVVDASRGAVLTRANQVHDAAFTYRAYADVDGDHRPKDGPIGDTMPYVGDLPDGHYPTTQVPADLVTIDGFNAPGDPWLADGATQTIGNNVNAQVDTDIDGVGDLAAVTTAPGVFDYAHDINLAAEANDTQKMAAATNLFFLVNWLHDYWYDSGFDEKAKNAQTSNFGRGGVGGDAINAIAQYGAPDVRDNSAMAVPDDGEAPEMEMFIWSGRLNAAVTNDNDTLTSFVAEFGPQSFSVSGEAILVDDGAAIVTDACEAITNDVTGKIAIIDRGICSFEAKVLAADAAGAIGAIIVNNNADEGAPFMPGDPQIDDPDLPVLSVSLQDGRDLKEALFAGAVTLTLDRVQDPDRDGSLDTSVAAHEWGHYLHLRQVTCNSQQCAAQSEGWGDFNALMTLVREGDDLDGAYNVGAFAVGAFPDDPAYFGIRRYPYSTNFLKSPLTFGHIADDANLPETAPVAVFAAQNTNNAEVHAAGEVWSAMMFESMMAMLDEASQAGAARGFEATRRHVGDLVIEGMQLAPEDPTFTEMRDALLAAAITFDAADGTHDAATIAAAFARRGAGTCALSPERYDDTFNAVVETFTLQGNLAITDVSLTDDLASCDDDGILDAGETGTLTIQVANLSTSPSAAGVVSVSADADVSFDASVLNVAALAPYATVTLTTQVSLAIDAPRVTSTSFTAKVTTAETCNPDGFTLSTLTNADDVATGLKVDSVEGTATNFTTDGRFSEFIWTVEPSDFGPATNDWGPGNHYWFGGNAPFPTDTALVSPVVSVSDDRDLVLVLKHRWFFEFDADLNYDGGVIELSSDGGTTWDDLSAFADETTYNGIVGQANQQQNPLDGRDGFVAQNPNYPDVEDVSINLGRSLAGKDVQVRFRIGTDRGAAADGWEIDNIGFEGIDNAPFSGLIQNEVDCDGVIGGEGEGEVAEGEGEGEDADIHLGGGGCGSCASSSSELSALALASLVLLRRRRR